MAEENLVISMKNLILLLKLLVSNIGALNKKMRTPSKREKILWLEKIGNYLSCNFSSAVGYAKNWSEALFLNAQ